MKGPLSARAIHARQYGPRAFREFLKGIEDLSYVSHVFFLCFAEQYNNNDNVHVALCSQVELGKPLVGPTKL